MSFLFALTACGGGGGGSQVPARAAASAPADGTARIIIPAATVTSNQRTRAFISPSAVSVAISVNGAAATTDDISTTSTLCTTANGARTCTVPFTAPNGTDTIAFTLLTATGAILGSGSAIADVSGGAAFTVTAAIGGTVSRIVVAETTPLTQGTPATVPVTVSAQDAGGNTIIGADPYAAPIALTDSDTSGSTTLSTTAVTSPSTAVTLTYTGGAVSGGTVTISATAANVGSGSVTPAQVAVTSGSCAPSNASGHLYVANDGGGNVLQFAPPYNGQLGSNLNSVGNPVAIHADNAGNVFAAAFGSSGSTSSAGDIVELSPPYTTTPTIIGAGHFQGPRGIAIDGNRVLYVTDSGANRVIAFAPPYTAAPTVLISNIPNIYAIAMAPNCDLFVTSGSSVVEYAPPYTGAPVGTITQNLSAPQGLAFDGAGDIFIADPALGDVVEYAPPYTGTALATLSFPSTTVLGLAVDSSNNLFVDEYNRNEIQEFAPPYTGAATATMTASGGLSLPADIGFGP